MGLWILKNAPLEIDGFGYEPVGLEAKVILLQGGLFWMNQPVFCPIRFQNFRKEPWKTLRNSKSLLFTGRGMCRPPHPAIFTSPGFSRAYTKPLIKYMGGGAPIFGAPPPPPPKKKKKKKKK